MKIVIATPLYPPDVGGPATYAKALEDALPSHGVEVVLVSFHAVRHLPKGIAHLVYAFKLFRASRGCDAILALDPASVGLPAAIIARLTRTPFVVKIVGDYAWEQGRQRFGVTQGLDEFVVTDATHFTRPVRILRTVQTFVARSARQIIVPSEYLKRIVSAWGISSGVITVVYNTYNGVGPLPSRDTLREALGLSGTIILSAGRLVPWKGFGTLIGLMREVRQTIPDAQLIIAGGGPLEGELRAQVEQEGAEEFVTLLGNIPHDVLMRYIAAADLFVLNTGYEGLSHQLLEVLAVGTPIVTTNVGGNPELIEDGVTGLLVPYDDNNRLYAAITTLLLDKKLSHQCTENGKQFVAQFSKERMISGTLSTLRHLS